MKSRPNDKQHTLFTLDFVIRFYTLIVYYCIIIIIVK